MATIKGIQTVDSVQVLNVETNPASGGGTPSPIGSIALVSDGSGLFYKTGAADTDYTRIPVTNNTFPNSANIGDLLYASAANTYSNLADIAAGNVLLSGGVGVAPAYGKVGLTTHVTGTLPIANGGTNSSTALTGSKAMFSNGASIVEDSTFFISAGIFHISRETTFDYDGGAGTSFLLNITGSTVATTIGMIADDFVIQNDGLGTFYILGSTGEVQVSNGFTVITGNITMLGGNILFNVPDNGLQFMSGANQRAGNATLVGGTVTVANTTVTANTLVLLSRKTIGGTAGNLTYTLNAGVDFTINSDNALDTSTVTYLLIELN